LKASVAEYRTAMVEELVSPDLTKSNTTTASTSQRKVLKVWLQDPFQVYQLPEPKLAVLESVGGTNSNGHG
jgi:hypothetical protein